LYWPLLEPAGALEILAHRIVWSMVTMAVLVLVLHRTRTATRLVRSRRTRWLLLAASLVIGLNWLGFIFGVNNGRVLEVSLGYFVNPLVSVLLGVLVLGETLRPAQWGAIGLAALAVVVLTVDYGRLPWVALLLAFSFGTYGLLKKKAGAGSVESLAVETVFLAPVALAYLAWLAATGAGTFLTDGVGHALLLTTTGAVTALPLICFGAAALRLPLSTLGLLQYLAPTLHFALGVWVFHEPLSPVRLVGFVLVWLALGIFTVEALHHRRRQLALAAQASAT
jgi:chloramphenicol-sensitive protein RarD